MIIYSQFSGKQNSVIFVNLYRYVSNYEEIKYKYKQFSETFSINK